MFLSTVGWTDFEKNVTHSMLCQIVVGPQLQMFNVHIFMLPIHLSQGLT